MNFKPFYPTYLRDSDDEKVELNLMGEIENVFGEISREMDQPK
jgi:hypothetical protein